MDEELGFYRLKHVLEVFPVSKDTWLDGVKTGRFPKPIKLSDGITFWNKSDVHDLCRRVREGGAG